MSESFRRRRAVRPVFFLVGLICDYSGGDFGCFVLFLADPSQCPSSCGRDITIRIFQRINQCGNRGIRRWTDRTQDLSGRGASGSVPFLEDFDEGRDRA